MKLANETGDRRLLDEYLLAAARADDYVDPPEDDLDEIQEAMWPLCYEILAFEASTLADLALQMRAVQYIESEWWEEELPPTDEHGSYMDGYAGRRLVESALRMIEQPGVTLTGNAGTAGSDTGEVVTAENVGAFSGALCAERHSSCRHRNWLE